MDSDTLQIVRAAPEHLDILTEFFARVAADEASRHFHPHPFDAAGAATIASFQGRDLYYLAIANGVIGYGMLRGWDEGYEVPSLGIVVDPAWRGRGIARLLMQFLHGAARIRGCERIRLKVYPENVRAKALYESLGYRFGEVTDGQLIGSLSPIRG